MAKKGRHSIRNKRKSVKKHSHKRRSKTMRYLRGGVLSNEEYYRLSNEEKDRQLGNLQRAHQERMARMSPEQQKAFYDSDGDVFDGDDSESDGGGRRRYHRRKQSKSRSKSRKH